MFTSFIFELSWLEWNFTMKYRLGWAESMWSVLKALMYSYYSSVMQKCELISFGDATSSSLAAAEETSSTSFFFVHKIFILFMRSHVRPSSSVLEPVLMSYAHNMYMNCYTVTRLSFLIFFRIFKISRCSFGPNIH